MDNVFRHIDPSLLLKTVANNHQALLQLLEVFVRINPSMMARLTQAFAAKDVQEFSLISHSIKNSMLLLGAAHTALWLERYEMQTRANTFSFNRNEFDRLLQEVGDITCEVEACIESLQAKLV